MSRRNGASRPESAPARPEILESRIDRCPRGSGLLAVEVRCKRHVSAPHAHPGFTIGVTESGWERFEMRGTSGEVPAGAVIAIEPEAIHADRSGFRSVCHSCMVYFPQGYPGWSDIRVEPPVLRSERVAGGVRRLAAAIGEGRGPGEAEALLQALRAEGVVEPAAPAAEVPSREGMSPFAFIRSVRRAHGCTPGELERQRMARHAAELLQAGVQPAEAALAAGYCDQSHMNRQFPRYFGVTPAEFQRRNRVQDREPRRA